jgi:hypothetical protein
MTIIASSLEVLVTLNYGEDDDHQSPRPARGISNVVNEGKALFLCLLYNWHP